MVLPYSVDDLLNRVQLLHAREDKNMLARLTVTVKRPRIVMVFVEPTPYIVGLINALRHVWDGPIEAYYITTNLSQPWNLRCETTDGEVLPTGIIASLRALWSILGRHDNNIILHLAGWGELVLVGAMLMAKSLRIPVAIESDTAEGQSESTWRNPIKRLFYPLLFRLPDHFLPAGTRQVGYLRRFGVEQGRMTVSQMSVDVCAYQRFGQPDRQAARCAVRAKWSISADERVALYVGRLEKNKGLSDLLSAFLRVAKEERDVRLLVVGDGSLRPLVEEVATRPGSRVLYLGRLSGYDIRRAYVAADFLVLPSRFEPWGLVVNEAMASGLPVIVSDRVGCSDDLVRHGETGLIVSAGRDAELSEAIQQLLRDTAGRRRMGYAARNLISNWTLENEARNIVSAWREIAR
jgi:glycosyltransferase involved in cell wall biosynthesis